MMNDTQLKVQTYDRAESFLVHTAAELERNEAANSLVLGLCERLRSKEELGDHSEPRPLLLTVNDSNELRLAGLMTPPFNFLIAQLEDQQSAAVRRAAEWLLESTWSVPGVLAPKAAAAVFVNAFTSGSGQSSVLAVEERIYELKELAPLELTNGALRQAGVADRKLLVDWALAFHREATPEDPSDGLERAVDAGLTEDSFYILDDPAGVPVCMLKRSRPTRHTITVNYVYTPPPQRGRGFATRAVADLSRLLLEEGWQSCTLFTDLANQTSNSIYQRIGYRPLIDVDLYRFKD